MGSHEAHRIDARGKLAVGESHLELKLKIRQHSQSPHNHTGSNVLGETHGQPVVSLHAGVW